MTVEAKRCNCCGKKIKIEQGIQKEDALEIMKNWGYFSGKDMERHSFLICESCYDKWVSGFAIPPEVGEQTEVL